MADLPSAHQMRKVLRSLKTPEQIATEKILKTIGSSIQNITLRGGSQLTYAFPHQIAELPMFDRTQVFEQVARILDKKDYRFEISEDEERLIIDWSPPEEIQQIDEYKTGEEEEEEEDEEDAVVVDFEEEMKRKAKAAAELEAIRRKFTKGRKKA